jgi:hypothetical protein
MPKAGRSTLANGSGEGRGRGRMPPSTLASPHQDRQRLR